MLQHLSIYVLSNNNIYFEIVFIFANNSVIYEVTFNTCKLDKNRILVEQDEIW